MGATTKFRKITECILYYSYGVLVQSKFEGKPFPVLLIIIFSDKLATCCDKKFKLFKLHGISFDAPHKSPSVARRPGDEATK
jgi:hypothetical protein